jgi:hypothetical protein
MLLKSTKRRRVCAKALIVVVTSQKKAMTVQMMAAATRIAVARAIAPRNRVLSEKTTRETALSLKNGRSRVLKIRAEHVFEAGGDKFPLAFSFSLRSPLRRFGASLRPAPAQ